MRHPRLLVLLALSLARFASGQDYATSIKEAGHLYQNKKFAESLPKFNEALKADAATANDFFAGAFAAAAAGQTDLALDWLQRSAERGYPNPQSLQSNPGFTSLHDSPRWKDIVAAVQKNRKQLDASIDWPLRKQLRVHPRRGSEIPAANRRGRKEVRPRFGGDPRPMENHRGEGRRKPRKGDRDP